MGLDQRAEFKSFNLFFLFGPINKKGNLIIIIVCFYCDGIKDWSIIIIINNDTFTIKYAFK